MAIAMRGMLPWMDNETLTIYVDSWRMLKYDKVEKCVEVIGTLEDVERISREYGITFLKPGESIPEPEIEPPKSQGGFAGFMRNLLFKQ